MDLQECGIEHNSCIDKTLIERIVGKPLSLSTDKGVCRVWTSVHIIPAGMDVFIAMQQREKERQKKLFP